MNNDIKTYSTKEVAKRLHVEPVTIRKYTQILEEKGYQYTKDERGWRLFTEEDIKGLEYLCLLKLNGKSLDDATDHIANLYRSNLSVSQHDMTIQGPVNPIQDFMNRQEAFNQDLIDRLNKQQEFIETSLKKRDELLLSSVKEILETKKMIAAASQKKRWQFWK